MESVVYWYILDFNRTESFDMLRRSERPTQFMPDCKTAGNSRFLLNDRIFERSTTQVIEHGAHVDYVVYLTEITEMKRLLEKRRRRSAEPGELTRRQWRANEDLEGYARQAETARVPDAIREIRGFLPAVRVPALTAFGDAETVSGAMAAGCNGFLLKVIDPDKLHASLLSVAGGMNVYDASVMAKFRKNMEEKASSPCLSEREIEVLRLGGRAKPMLGSQNRCPCARGRSRTSFRCFSARRAASAGRSSPATPRRNG